MNSISSRTRLFFQDRRKVLIAAFLAAILLFGIFLRFYHLGAVGVGNTYYAAGVKSMLQSWHNFFFVAFEPGGTVSLDKPPLGFWLEAASAYFLGVNGFALALPNAIAGVLSIFVLYKLVRRPFGPWAGLVAALALAVMPVAISTERNNTIDGMLVFVLLLAAWAFLQAVHTGKLRWLLLGAFIVGLGFNIKMLEAFMPLPAFYALYFFGAKYKWWKKVVHLLVATVILLIVSFSWAVVVDLVPASNRPYVDSTDHNTVMELIFGHNGIERLTRVRQGIGLDGGQDGLFGTDGPARNQQQAPGQTNPPAGDRPDSFYGQDFQPGAPNGQNFPSAASDGQNFPSVSRGGGNFPGGVSGRGEGGGSMDFGSAGTLRLFTEPLVDEASWLLPFALAGLVVLVILLWKRPFGEQHTSLILWGGWLLPAAIYFTYSQGLMHSYYLIMLGAPIAALVAMTGWALWQLIRRKPLLGWGLTLLLVAGTVTFQAVTLWQMTTLAPWAIGAAVGLFGLGLCFLAVSMVRVRFAPAAMSLLLAAMLVAPALWSVLTTFNSSPNNALPSSGPGGIGTPGSFGNAIGGGGNARFNLPTSGNAGGSSRSLLDYLLANTEPATYLVATDTANDAASYILETGRPVLTIGGFLGQYQEVSLEQFTALVESGQLRFVLGQNMQRYEDISSWVQENCQAVDTYNLSTSTTPTSGNFGGGRQTATLYDCGS